MFYLSPPTQFLLNGGDPEPVQQASTTYEAPKEWRSAPAPEPLERPSSPETFHLLCGLPAEPHSEGFLVCQYSDHQSRLRVSPWDPEFPGCHQAPGEPAVPGGLPAPACAAAPERASKAASLRSCPSPARRKSETGRKIAASSDGHLAGSSGSRVEVRSGSDQEGGRRTAGRASRATGLPCNGA